MAIKLKKHFFTFLNLSSFHSNHHVPPLIQVHHFCHLDDPPEPTPLVTPPQSSDDEEVMNDNKNVCHSCVCVLKQCYSLWRCLLQDVCTYLSPAASPPQTLGATGIGSSSPREQPLHPSFPSPRKQPHHPSFSAPEGPATLSCHLPPYMNTEHAQSWPSINVSSKQCRGLHKVVNRFFAFPVGKLGHCSSKKRIHMKKKEERETKYEPLFYIIQDCKFIHYSILALELKEAEKKLIYCK